MAMPDVLRLYFGESNAARRPRSSSRSGSASARGRLHLLLGERGPAVASRGDRRPVPAASTRSSSIPARRSSSPPPASRRSISAIRSVLDPGDEAIILTPAWPNGAAIVALANATPIEIPHVLVGERYDVDFDALEAAVTPRTRLLLYTSPSNPLGWVATDDEQDRLLDFARAARPVAARGRGLRAALLRTDEPGTAVPSILRKATREDAVVDVVQSFSKTYCMTGWRVGWLVCRSRRGPEGRAAERVRRLPRGELHPEGAAQAALAEGEGWAPRAGRALRANRDLCLASLRDMPGVTVPEPDGAFYLFPRIDGLDRLVRRSAGACSSSTASASHPASPSAPAARARCGSATRRIAASSSRR